MNSSIILKTQIKKNSLWRNKNKNGGLSIIKINIRIDLIIILGILLSLPTIAIAQPPPLPPTVTDCVVPVDDLVVPFGNLPEGISSDLTVTVTNNDPDSELNIDNIAQTDTLSAPFSKETDNCSNQTISPAASCTLIIRFSPTFTSSFKIPLTFHPMTLMNPL